jgi:outer membrane protein
MLRRPRPRRVGHTSRSAALLALLPLTAFASDTLQLAPSTPDRPWIIQPSVLSDQPRTVDTDQGTARRDSIPIERDHAYDLAELIDLAQRSNPETREAWEQARQAALAVGLVESSYSPQISIEAIGGFQRTPLPIPTTLIPQGYFTSDTREIVPMVALKWLLFDFGRRAGQEQTARANSFVANVAFTGAHQKLIFAVSRAYFTLGAARGRVSAARLALKSAEIVQHATESRRERGLVTVVALAQAQRQTAQARLALAKVAGRERTAYADLIASIGIAADSRIEVADNSGQPLPAEPAREVDSMVRDALANRPDVIAAFSRIEAAEGALKTERAAWSPTISVTGQVYQNIGALSTNDSPYSNINKPGASIFLVFSMPLYDGGARTARASIAQSHLAAARDKLEQVRDAAAQQVVSAYNDLKTGLSAYSAALVLQGAAQTAYDAALESYLHGVGTYTDLASEQSSLAQADAEKEDAHASVFTAAAALAFATGAIQSK